MLPPLNGRLADVLHCAYSIAPIRHHAALEAAAYRCQAEHGPHTGEPRHTDVAMFMRIVQDGISFSKWPVDEPPAPAKEVA